ncbi:class I SAM-dependent methyltransferase [Streptomyces sp. YIM 98790]|uniref:class I SAM-dependent methyltransferase n=1 Tax=Streptomyces sp. YIM 98790 TaxID=2689077 RepID=UPI0028BEC7F6|nr:class I SAM-dependent methyltransferase [Streptomyces sp. YIM 98790]
MAEHLSLYADGALYDALYQGRGKDYAHEASVVAKHIRARRPAAVSLLDVGCGTGAHLEHLVAEFPDAAGVDIARGMLDVVRARLPRVPVHLADMRNLRLGRSFDAVVSLFCAPGYLSGTDELDTAVGAMARHLVPGGVLVLEPWWFPDNFTPGHVGRVLTTAGDMTVARVTHTVREGFTSRMTAHYLVARPHTGVRHFSDTHVMSLYSREQYASALTRAGCSVEYIEGEYPGNGLFVGVRQPGELPGTGHRKER